MRQSQVGHFDVPDSPGGFGNNKPKGVVRGPVGQTVGQRTIAGGGALEGNGQIQSRPDQASRPQQRPQHPGYQLAVCSPQVKENPVLYVEKHNRILDASWIGAGKVGPKQCRIDPQATTLRQSIDPKLKWCLVGNQRIEGRQCVRKGGMLQDTGPVELQKPGLEKPCRAGNELPSLQPTLQGSHHNQHPLAPKQAQ